MCTFLSLTTQEDALMHQGFHSLPFDVFFTDDNLYSFLSLSVSLLLSELWFELSRLFPLNTA